MGVISQLMGGHILLRCIYILYIYTLRLFNIAMENGPFIDALPIKTSIYNGFSYGFSMAMLNDQMVYIYIHNIYP